MSNIPASIQYTRFMQNLDDPASKKKIAAATQNWIRDQLHEKRFSSQIIPLEPVSIDQLQVSARGHDTPIRIVPIEAQNKAVSITFRGNPDARLISAKRVEMAFYTVASELLHKTEEELLVYQKMDMPITKMMEDGMVNAIMDTEDRTFTVHMEATVQGMQTAFNGGAVTTLNATSVQAGTIVEHSVFKSSQARIATPGTESAIPTGASRPDYIKLFQLLDGRRLRAYRVLFTDYDYDALLEWTAEDVGSEHQTKTTKDGWFSNVLLGRQFTKTIKTDILRPGNIYCVTKDEFIGKFNRLTELKTYIDKEFRTIKMQSWENVGMVFVNASSIVKMETYSADATTNDTDSVRADVIPKDEADLGEENNKITDGLYYPTIEAY